jgi:hypothetical protein
LVATVLGALGAQADKSIAARTKATKTLKSKRFMVPPPLAKVIEI